jgi:hypothetical protein
MAGGAVAPPAATSPALADGDSLRAAGSYKSAVSKCKDALAMAEGA